MEKKILYVLPMMMLALGLASCDSDEIKQESVITVDSYQQNQFDKWLEANFVNPYNIDFKYRYEEIESDYNYYTVPANLDDAIVMAHLVKYLCIETYNEVAGTEFTRQTFPKMFYLIGEWEYRNNGTFILGTAEGGKKILLAGVSYLPAMMNGESKFRDFDFEYKNDIASNLNHYYIKTIHHEFTHILNQTKDYSTDFQQVTGSGYVADSWSEYPYKGYDSSNDENNGITNNCCYLRGFISPYSQHSHGEDFAEMVSEYITHDQAWWDAQLEKADGKWKGTPDQASTGKELLENKLEIVRNYMSSSWGIDLDKLRDTILRRQGDVVAGLADLTDITVQ